MSNHAAGYDQAVTTSPKPHKKRRVCKALTVLALAASLGAISVSPSLASARSTVGTGGWTNTNANAADSRANLSEKVLNPSAVTKVKYLRSLSAPPPRSAPPCEGGVRYVAAPLPSGGSLYAITSERLSKYNPATGSLIWRKKLSPYFIANSLAITSGLVIVGAIGCFTQGSDPGGSIDAFNASTGALVWSEGGPSGLNQAVTVGTSYVVAEGADASGNDTAVLNVNNGSLVWDSYACNNGSPNEPVVVGLTVIRENCDNQGNLDLQALNIATGAVKWTLPGTWRLQRGDLAGSVGSHVYATDPSGTVEALNPRTGQEEYALSQAVNVLAVDGRAVYATCGSQGPYVCAYSIYTGALEWQNTQLAPVYQSPNLAAEADGVLYLGTGIALNAGTGTVVKKLAIGGATALAVGDGRIAVVSSPSVLDLFGLPGS